MTTRAIRKFHEDAAFAPVLRRLQLLEYTELLNLDDFAVAVHRKAKRLAGPGWQQVVPRSLMPKPVLQFGTIAFWTLGDIEDFIAAELG